VPPAVRLTRTRSLVASSAAHPRRPPASAVSSGVSTGPACAWRVRSAFSAVLPGLTAGGSVRTCLPRPPAKPPSGAGRWRRKGVPVRRPAAGPSPRGSPPCTPRAPR